MIFTAVTIGLSLHFCLYGFQETHVEGLVKENCEYISKFL